MYVEYIEVPLLVFCSVDDDDADTGHPVVYT